MAAHRRHIMKIYYRTPKITNYYTHLKQTLDDYFFYFHCNHRKMNFEQKLEIFRSVIAIKPNVTHEEILGVQNVISSLSEDLRGIQYSDEIELNVSQFINLLHYTKYYDRSTWLSALDVYHKQGHINWEEYKLFTNSLYFYQGMVFEEWENNIIRDISQECWNDFVGFVENSDKLQLDHEEMLQTYQNIRKFKLFATQDNLRSIIQHYGSQLARKRMDPNFQISSYYYSFILKFTFDHAVQKELIPGLEKLFQKLIYDIYEVYDNFRSLHTLIDDADSYLSMLRLASQNFFHNIVEEHISLAWSQEMFRQFVEKRVSEDIYKNMDLLIQMKNHIQNLTHSFFSEQQTAVLKTMVDACAVESLKNLKQRKQNLSAILMYQKTFDEEQQSLDYMAVIGRLEVTLDTIICNDQELIQCLKDLDNSELVYYMLEFLSSAVNRIAKDFNVFESEDWCFVYYIGYKYLVKDQQQIEPDPQHQELYQNLNILKQYIRLTYSTNYRRAIPLQSNFFKIFTVVEQETFYADDIINYY